MISALRGLFARPDQKRARQALAGEGPLSDRFEKVHSQAEKPEARAILELTRQASEQASGVHREALLRTGLESLVQSVDASGGALAGLGARLLTSVSEPTERVRVARAVLDHLGENAPEDETRESARFLRAVTAGAHYLNSQSAGARAGLESLAAGGSLPVQALAAAAEGLQGEGRDDAAAMRRKAVELLSGQDPLARMGHLALDKMRFSDTSSRLVERTLELEGTELPEAALALLDCAYVGKDSQGNWADERSPVARVLLAELGGPLADSARALLDASSYSASNEAIARALIPAAPGVTESQQAGMFLTALQGALAAKNTEGTYKDDRTPVARQAAQHFQASADPAVARLARMASAALEGRKFTSSNVAIGEVFLRALQGGSKDPYPVAAAMIEGCTSADNSEGTWQPDRATVARQLVTALKSQETDPGRLRLLGMAEAAMGESLGFATTTEQVALQAFRGIGSTRDSDLGRLARVMVENSQAGRTTEQAYKDDKTVVGLRCAAYLAAHGEQPSTRDWASFLQLSLDRMTFTTTGEGVASVVFAAIAAGKPSDPASLARAARQMVQESYAGKTSDGRYEDDKAKVARNAVDHLVTLQPEPASLMLQACLQDAHYSTSIASLADTGLAALASGKRSPAELASLGKQLIACGEVTSAKQDRGPLAMAVFRALAEHEQDDSLWAAHGMMNTSVDFRVRQAVAGMILDAWASGRLETFLERELAQAAPHPGNHSMMLQGALRAVAATRGEAAVQAAEQAIARAGDSPQALFEALKNLPDVRREVKNLLAAVAEKKGGAVEERAQYVLVGGVRIRKAA
ncbi:MAG: hypothetical protein AMXMBFR33_37000 [Candidatus Xenobia bacterium]